MKIIFAALATVSMLVVPVTAHAKKGYAAQQCQSWFSKIDRNKDGTIGPNENSAKYFDKVTLAGASNDTADNYIMSKKFFMIECKIGSLGTPQV